jgi:hypothetical protein
MNCRKISLVSKYSVFIVGTRQIKSIFKSRSLPSPLQVSLLHPIRLAEFSVNSAMFQNVVVGGGLRGGVVRLDTLQVSSG